MNYCSNITALVNFILSPRHTMLFCLPEYLLEFCERSGTIFLTWICAYSLQEPIRMQQRVTSNPAGKKALCATVFTKKM